jgi:hypothetical protein
LAVYGFVIKPNMILSITQLIIPSTNFSSCDALTFAVWFAKSRFQPDIETSVLIRIEAAAEPDEEETIVSNRRLGNKNH